MESRGMPLDSEKFSDISESFGGTERGSAMKSLQDDSSYYDCNS
jgi:hypothetical protein